MDRLLFGPAGVPLSAKSRSTPDGILQVRKLGLDGMEMEFVRGVRMTSETAKQVRALAEKNKVLLTAHGPYYINLNSHDKAITEASIKRVLDTARIADLCGAYSITFHAAYYVGTPKDKVFEIVKGQMKRIMRTLSNEGIKIWVRPETTGKASQFGDIDELIKLSQEIGGVLPCIDFSHIHARSGGKFNTLPEFRDLLSRIETGLGKEALKNMHIHLSGIQYTDKGERNHLELRESDMNYKALMKALREHRCAGIVISESPNLEEDAALMKEEYERV